jgi:hypothetical protein
LSLDHSHAHTHRTSEILSNETLAITGTCVFYEEEVSVCGFYCPQIVEDFLKWILANWYYVVAGVLVFLGLVLYLIFYCCYTEDPKRKQAIRTQQKAQKRSRASRMSSALDGRPMSLQSRPVSTAQTRRSNRPVSNASVARPLSTASAVSIARPVSRVVRFEEESRSSRGGSRAGDGSRGTSFGSDLDPVIEAQQQSLQRHSTRVQYAVPEEAVERSSMAGSIVEE